MKQMKYIIVMLVLFLSLALVGCGGTTPGGQGGGQGGGGTTETAKKIEEVKEDVLGAFSAYSVADHGSFKLIVTKGDKTSTVDMTFNYDGGKSGIVSLKTILTDASGTISCYITDETAYINRYNQSKTIANVTSNEGDTILEEYTFDAFTEKVKLMLCASFFKYSTIDSFENGVLKATLDVSKFEVDSESTNEDLYVIYDALVACSSVKLEATYNEATLTSVKVIMAGEVTSSIELQFVQISDTEIEIEFPDFSDYKR